MAAAIVLAGGASTRLGEAKQLVRLCGELLLERAVRVATAAGLAPVVVVLGAHAEAIERQWNKGTAQVVLNLDWEEGMGSSIRAGILALPAEISSVIVMTCDQPAVTPAHLRDLVQQCVDKPVASSYDGRHGVPACFPRHDLPRLAQLAGDQGARSLLQDSPAVNLPGGELDIDSPQALALARQQYG